MCLALLGPVAHMQEGEKHDKKDLLCEVHFVGWHARIQGLRVRNKTHNWFLAPPIANVQIRVVGVYQPLVLE